MMDDALEPQKALLECQQSWTSYFFDPKIVSIVYFLQEGLSLPPQDPLGVSFSLAQDQVLARDQQEAEEGEDEGSLGVQTCWPLRGKSPS